MGVFRGRWYFLLRRTIASEDGRFSLMGAYVNFEALRSARTQMIRDSQGSWTEASFVIAQEMRIPDGVLSPPHLEAPKVNEGTKGSNENG